MTVKVALILVVVALLRLYLLVGAARQGRRLMNGVQGYSEARVNTPTHSYHSHQYRVLIYELRRSGANNMSVGACAECAANALTRQMRNTLEYQMNSLLLVKVSHTNTND